MRHKDKSLRRVLSYKNPEIVARFCKDFGVSQKTGNVIFKDMLRFLWLSCRAELTRPTKVQRTPKRMDMLESMMIVDEMWHIFVLYTHEYSEFSHKYFGQFIHHIPEPVLKGAGRKRKAAKTEMSGVGGTDELIDFVWDELGPATAARWFVEFPKKFPQREILRRRLKYSVRRV